MWIRKTKSVLFESSSPLLLAIAFMGLVYAGLTLAFSLRAESPAFDLTQSVPAGVEKGRDFVAMLPMATAFIRDGVAGYLRVSPELSNVYPPFYTWFIMPAAFLPQDTAYAAWTVLLHFALAALVYLGFRSAKDLTSRDRAFGTVCFSLIFFQSYPFLFALERGNGDLFALLFAALCLLSLASRRPGLAAPMLAVSFHLKLYPAILGALVLGRLGWRHVLRFSAWAAAGFFVMGWDGFVGFVTAVRTFTKFPFLWAGNHSMASFVYRLHEVKGWDLEASKLWGKALLAVLALVFAVGWFRIYWKKNIYSTLKLRPILPAEKAFAGMAFQFMSLIPSTSHDYKLVIQYFPFVWLVATPYSEFRSPRSAVSISSAALALCIGFLMAPLNGTMGIKTSALLISFCCYAVVCFLETATPARSPA